MSGNTVPPFGTAIRADVLWLIRGGFGSARLLAPPHNTWQHAPHAPPVVAFSDGTALLAAWHRAGWSAWSGPPLTQLPRLDDLSLARLRATLVAGHLAPFGELRTFRRGRVRGPLFVANLCVLASLAGTPAAPDLDGHILVLEDTGEPPYKIDRMMTQLLQAGVLDDLVGLVFADFTADRKVPPAVLTDLDSVFRHFVNDVAEPRNMAVCAGLPIGHGSANTLLPVGPASGYRAILDASESHATLSFERVTPAVP